MAVIASMMAAVAGSARRSRTTPRAPATSESSWAGLAAAIFPPSAQNVWAALRSLGWMAITHRPVASAAALGDASDQLNRARAELRSIAGGIAPTALIHGSLTGALQEVALRASVPTTVRVTGSGHPTELAASTIYYVVAECLTNIAKHAHAKTAAVEVELADPIRLSVTDDGRGGAVLDGRGTGLRGLVDRADAQGGTLDVTSDAGGTTITLTLPLQPGGPGPA